MKRHDLEARIADLVDEAITLGKHPHHWPFQRIQARRQVIREILEAIDDWDNGRGSATLPNIVNAEPLTEEEAEAVKKCGPADRHGMTTEELREGLEMLICPPAERLEPRPALCELAAAYAQIEEVLGMGWQESEDGVEVWTVVSVPRAEVPQALYDAQATIEKKYSAINWTFEVLATDDPEVTDTRDVLANEEVNSER